MIKVAFDIDDTLWKVRYRPHLDQVPDYDLIQVLRWFYKNGDKIYFWSAGGVDYCQTIVTKLGLDDYGEVIEKGSMKVDIAFDDAETSLGKVDVRVDRYVEKLIPVTKNFDQTKAIGKLSIMAGELPEKDDYSFEIGYIEKEDGKHELVEISLVPKRKENKNE